MLTQETIKDLLGRAAWTFVQAFGSTFIIFAPGIWVAPNLNNAKAAALAAFSASLAAGISAVKSYVKQTL